MDNNRRCYQHLFFFFIFECKVVETRQHCCLSILGEKTIIGGRIPICTSGSEDKGTPQIGIWAPRTLLACTVKHTALSPFSISCLRNPADLAGHHWTVKLPFYNQSILLSHQANNSTSIDRVETFGPKFISDNVIPDKASDSTILTSLFSFKNLSVNGRSIVALQERSPLSFNHLMTNPPQFGLYIIQILHFFHFAFLHFNVKWWKLDVSVIVVILVEFDKN